MKQTEWKILYSDLQGAAKHAVTLISKEAGQFLIRESGVYRIYVLPCEKEGASLAKNNFIIGLWENSVLLRSYLKEEEVPAEGFAVKVIPNPENEEGRLVLLCAHTPEELYYAALHFLDDYVPQNAPRHGSNYMPDLIYDRPLPEYSYAEIPENYTRSIFTWGHSINDYRKYIDNMARAKYNELILWNDFVPVNIEDILDYAHSYGIRVLLGYAWGWKPDCKSITELPDETLAAIKQEILTNYRDHYASLPIDGIYFQSFTEMKRDNIGERSIAKTVVELVNEVSAELRRITPDLRLIFGLHATSVREQLDEIAKVDPSVEILWEDCGEFPYHYPARVRDREKFEANFEFIKKILELRGGVGVGLVFKGMMVLDWKKFVSQSGPYLMGENSERLADHDRGIRALSWRTFSAAWMDCCPDALRMMHFINEHKLGQVNMCVAGTYDGGIYFPMALCGEMFRKAPESAGKLMKKVAVREFVLFQ